MKLVNINNRWPVRMPDHKADLPFWPWWEAQRLQAMYAAIRPGDTVWDIGTEQGELSALLAMWTGAEGNILLCEPVAASWPAIRAVWETNEISNTTYCYQGFVSDKTWNWDVLKHATMAYWPECSEGEVNPDPGFQHLDEHQGHTEIAQATLDDLWLGPIRQPDVISIDIEGAELRAMIGAERILTEIRPVVFISVHPEFMRDRYEDTPDALHGHMAKMGYEESYLGFDHEYHYLYKPKP